MIAILVASAVLLFLFMALVVGLAFILGKPKRATRKPQSGLADWERDHLVEVVEQHLINERRDQAKQTAARALQVPTPAQPG